MPPKGRKAPKWHNFPSLEEMVTLGEADHKFRSLQLMMLDELNSIAEYFQDCKDELKSAESEIKEKHCQQQNGNFLMPKSPAPKRRGRKAKNTSQTDDSMNTSNLRSSSRSTRSSRAASKAATAKISANVDDFNLSKKKRRPTNAARLELEDDSSNLEPPILVVSETIEEVAPLEENNKETKTRRTTRQRVSKVLSGTDDSGAEAVEQTQKSKKSVTSSKNESATKQSEEETIVTDAISNAVMEVDIEESLADVEDNGGSNNKSVRKSVRRTRQTMSRSQIVSTSSEDELPAKKARPSSSNQKAAPVPSLRSSTSVKCSPVPAPRTNVSRSSKVLEKSVEESESMEEELSEAPLNSTFSSADRQVPRFSAGEPIQAAKPVEEQSLTKQIIDEIEQETSIDKSVNKSKSNKKEMEDKEKHDVSVRSTRANRTKTTDDEDGKSASESSKDFKSEKSSTKVSSSQENEEESSRNSTRNKSKKSLNVLASESAETASSESETVVTEKSHQTNEIESAPSTDNQDSSNLDKEDTSTGESSEEKSTQSAGQRSTRTKQKAAAQQQQTSTASSSESSDDTLKRSARSKPKGVSAKDTDSEQIVASTPPKRSTRTKQRVAADTTSSDETVEQPKRSTRTKQKLPETDSESGMQKPVEELPTRSTRTKQKLAQTEQTNNQQNEVSAEPPKRSTRTKQKLPDSADDQPRRTTRTKTKMLMSDSEGSDKELIKSTASPRVKELAMKVCSPAAAKIASNKGVEYRGSPIADRVQQMEKAMKEAAGLKSKENKDPLRRSSRGGVIKPKRKSSLAKSLMKISTNMGVSVSEVLQDQEIKQKTPEKNKKLQRVGSELSMNKTINKSGTISRVNRPKVYASGGRGVSPAVFAGGSGSGSSSSTHLHGKMRSRIEIANRAVGAGLSNMTTKPGLSGMATWQVQKPKGPTLEEIQEAKEEEMKRKQEKEAEAVKRREEMLKKKAEEQREKRDERMRRAQEARKAQELQNQAKKTNKVKEAEEKLQALKKREERLKEEADLKKKKEEAKMREAEDRRKKEEDERQAKLEKAEEEARQKEEEERRRRREEEEDRKRKLKEEELKRAKKLEEKRRLEEAKRKEFERIEREREEMKKLKERERQEAEKAKKAAEEEQMNTTYEVGGGQDTSKMNTTQTINTTVNKTQTMNSTQNIDSYNMTPARHELPPAPSKSNNDYGLDDLRSDEETDDEEHPRKEIPRWALGAELRSSLLRQYYMPPDLTYVFSNSIQIPDLAKIFKKLKSRFYKRTSSCHWSSPPRVHY